MSLALSTLLYEWRRYLAAVIALAVAGVLVLSMTGMFMGVSKSFTATVDRSPGEVMILAPQAESLFSNNSGQPRRIIPKIYGNESVMDVQALNFSFAFWSNFPKEGQVAYAVPSSFPYSWLCHDDRLNYGQWNRGATWAIADHHSRVRDADEDRTISRERVASTRSRAIANCVHEKT